MTMTVVTKVGCKDLMDNDRGDYKSRSKKTLFKVGQSETI